MHEVSGLHHLQFAASVHQSLKALDDFRLLPLKETRAKYAELEFFALLKNDGQLGSTGHTRTG